MLKHKTYYVRQQKLNTEDKTELGWLYGIHSNYCSRDYVTKIVNEIIQKKIVKMLKKSLSDTWNESIEKPIKINTYQKKVLGRNNMYTRILKIKFPTLVKQ